MIEPRFGYADSGGLDIAYAVYGDGPVDVLVVTGMIGHIGMSEEVPWYREVVERVPNFARLIMMDKRGEGLSDGHRGLATYEDAIDDVRCVLDAVGSDRAVILVGTDACPLGILFAATHPDRVAGLACREGFARPFAVADESIHSAGPRTEFMRGLLELCRREWGSGGFLSITVDGAPDEKALRSAAARWERNAATPRRAEERFWMIGHTDVRVGAAARIVSDADGSQPGRFRLSARVRPVRRRTRGARNLRRAALRPDLLVDRRGGARGPRPRRTLRARGAWCRHRDLRSGC